MMLRKLRDQRGEFVFRNSIGLLIGALALSVSLSIFGVYHVIGVIREKVNQAVLAVAATNVAEFYGGARESDGFARHYAGNRATYIIDTEDVMTILASSVNATAITGDTITVSDTYELSNISTQFVNSSGSNLNFRTTLTVTVPLDLGNISVPISKQMVVKSSYNAKF